MMADAPFDPERLEAAEFDVVRRGFDPTEVRSRLREASDAYHRLRVERDELAGRLAEVDDAATGHLEASRVAAALGVEAAHVLEAAHQAATERAERAEREADAVRDEALSEAESIRSRAREESEEILGDAHRAAEELVADGRTRGRDMVNEAQTVRERMLGDLARKRQNGRAQVEQLKAARDRLLDSLSTVQASLDTALDDLVESVPDARAAAERAGLRVSAESEVTAEQLEAEIEAARLVGHPLVGDLPVAGSNSFDTGEVMALTDIDDALDTDTDSIDVEVGAASVEPEPEAVPADQEPEPEPEAVSVDQEPEPEPEPEAVSVDQEPEPEPEPEPEAVSVDQEPEPEAVSVDQEPEPEPEPQAVSVDQEPEPEPEGASVLEVDAVVEPDVSAADDTDGGPELYDVEAEGDEPLESLGADEPVAPSDDDATGVDVLFAKLRESHAPETDQPGEAEAGHELAEDPRLELRRETAARTVKALKKVLVDEQGTLLDGIRRGGGEAVHALIDDEDAHAKPYDEAARSALVAFVGQLGADAVDLSDALDEIHQIALAPVRQRLGEVADTEDVDELSDTVRALYRESRSRRLPEAASAAVVAADGLSVRAMTDGPVRWVVEPGGPCGPDCADNELAGEIGPGEPFPTGDLHPPSHAACTCRLVPVD